MLFGRPGDAGQLTTEALAECFQLADDLGAVTKRPFVSGLRTHTLAAPQGGSAEPSGGSEFLFQSVQSFVHATLGVSALGDLFLECAGFLDGLGPPGQVAAFASGAGRLHGLARCRRLAYH